MTQYEDLNKCMSLYERMYKDTLLKSSYGKWIAINQHGILALGENENSTYMEALKQPNHGIFYFTKITDEPDPIEEIG
jgi:hypothetical protein